MKNNWMTRNGPVMNRDLVEAVRALVDKRDELGTPTEFTWVKGHGTSIGNMAADNLAVEGSRKHLK